MNAKELDTNFSYDGNDLGAIYTKERTVCKVWAPSATSVKVMLYTKGDGETLYKTIDMKALQRGIWECQIPGDAHGLYYTYLVNVDGQENEVVDIYAKAAGVNGNRGMIVDLERTNPEGFENDIRPAFSGNETDAIIYEVHIRDISIDVASGIEKKGKFLGLTQKGTKNSNGNKTGLDHIVDLGVTHVQIQPSYDYATVDETNLDTKQYNWGYDPKNYNVPEGSYSTDPYDGTVRVKEMKEMVMALHKAGLRVNMDVVYNHTFNIEDSWFHKTVPDYYHRLNEDGTYSDGSGCNNETASDHVMMRKYIVDSVVYWAKEYHIDGFRFDLMGIHDIETMKAVREALDKVDPSIMVYGEGWSGGTVAYDYDKLAMKKNMLQLDRVGAFNDDIRDSIKGNVFLNKDRGFANGKDGMEEHIKFSVVGAIDHPQVKDEFEAWANEPTQSINYVSCHDNYTLWDKLLLSNDDSSDEVRIRMYKLCAAIVLTAQGVPFFLAGEELLRTKYGEENSYCSSDEINSIKWDEKDKVNEVYEYYKGLITFRKSHQQLRLNKASQIIEKLRFLENQNKNVVSYEIENVLVVYNANKEAVEYTLPEGNWSMYINADKAGCETLGEYSGKIKLEGISANVFVK